VKPTLILALNPSIDADWRVNDVLWEEKNNVQSERRWAGGKGINVARWLGHLGGEPQLLLPLGGLAGEELAGYLRAEQIAATIVPLREPTRVNVIVSTEAGRQMRFNPLGPKLTAAEWQLLLDGVNRALRQMQESVGAPASAPALGVRRSKGGGDAGALVHGESRPPRTDAHRGHEPPPMARQRLGLRQSSGAFDNPRPPKRQRAAALQDLAVVPTVHGKGGPAGAGSGEGLLVLSGSLPRGVPMDAYAQLIRLAARSGVRTLLDCDGPALAAAVKARPFLVKPNEHELAQWWGKPLRTETGIVRAARSLSAEAGGWVLVSRGGERSLLVNQSSGFLAFAVPRRVKPRNTVGAGDALLAAVAQALQIGLEPEEWLRRGLETGTAATQLQPGELPRRQTGTS
jgi:fructose-1-phosphate kinase PfkB-like protein